MKSDLPKGFPNQDYLKAFGSSARFRLIMPGDQRMACQRSTGKVKRIATMLHKEAAITQANAPFNLSSFIVSETTATTARNCSPHGAKRNAG
jgi:hypothetical protein